MEYKARGFSGIIGKESDRSESISTMGVG